MELGPTRAVSVPGLLLVVEIVGLLVGSIPVVVPEDSGTTLGERAEVVGGDGMCVVPVEIGEEGDALALGGEDACEVVDGGIEDEVMVVVVVVMTAGKESASLQSRLNGARVRGPIWVDTLALPPRKGAEQGIHSNSPTARTSYTEFSQSSASRTLIIDRAK